MPRQIFVNFAVKDLERSKTFFAGLGFSFNPRFTNDDAACMVIEENSIYAMLHTEKFFQTFLDGKAIADPRRSTEVMTCLSCASKDEVDRMVARASASGGKAYRQATDHGFMYHHAFEDPDGHIWEVAYLKGE
ncbi:MAG TPA: VOC family protein [Burkholderiales bacterium]|nr:VOC family protein [Burkholderiales bacterium]